MVGIAIVRTGPDLNEPVPVAMASDLSSFGFFQRQVRFVLLVLDFGHWTCVVQLLQYSTRATRFLIDFKTFSGTVQYKYHLNHETTTTVRVVVDVVKSSCVLVQSERSLLSLLILSIVRDCTRLYNSH